MNNNDVYLGNPNLKKANTSIEFSQDNILEFGISRESVENGEIAGMFFNYDDPVLKDWDKFIEYRFIASGRDKDELLDEVLENMDSGYKVIIGYERLGIGGGEGSVSVYRKLV